MTTDLTKFQIEIAKSDRPKVAFFDLDGTIVNCAGFISPASLQAIQKLRDNSVIVAIATGRPYFGSLEQIKALNINVPSLFFSGSLIINPATQEIIYEVDIEKQALMRFVSAARKLGLYCELYTRDSYFVEELNPRIADMHYSYIKCYPQQAKLEDIIQHKAVIKAVVISENEEEEKKLRSIAEICPDLYFIISKGASHPHINFGNITSPQASRENAFKIFLNHFKVKAEQVASFGDSEADAPFLSRAGFGVAVENAPESVKQVAKYITHSVEEDGVAFAIGQIFK